MPQPGQNKNSSSVLIFSLSQAKWFKWIKKPLSHTTCIAKPSHTVFHSLHEKHYSAMESPPGRASQPSCCKVRRIRALELPQTRHPSQNIHRHSHARVDTNTWLWQTFSAYCSISPVLSLDILSEPHLQNGETEKTNMYIYIYIY